MNRWIWKSAKVLQAITICLVILSGIILYFPPHHHYFALESQLMVWAFRAIGIVFVLLNGFTAPLTDFDLVSLITTSLSFLIIVIIAFSLGWFVKSLWITGWVARLMLMVGVIANSLLGTYLSAIGGLLVEPSYTACENAITDTYRVRVKVYQELAWPKGENLFVLITNNGGNNWQQALYHRRDDPQFDNDTLCGNIGHTNAQVYWVWIDDQAAITQNGGKTWKHLSKSDLSEFAE